MMAEDRCSEPRGWGARGMEGRAARLCSVRSLGTALECMGVASGRQAVIVKERTLGPVSESLSNVRSSLVPRILTDPRGSTFIQSGVGSTAVTSCGAEPRAPCGLGSSQARKA